MASSDLNYCGWLKLKPVVGKHDQTPDRSLFDCTYTGNEEDSDVGLNSFVTGVPLNANGTKYDCCGYTLTPTLSWIYDKTTLNNIPNNGSQFFVNHKDCKPPDMVVAYCCKY